LSEASTLLRLLGKSISPVDPKMEAAALAVAEGAFLSPTCSG